MTEQINWWDNPERSGKSFEEQGEVPSAFLTALGLIVKTFAELENAVSDAVWVLAGTVTDVGAIVTAEMSFKNKVNAMSSLHQHQAPDEHKDEYAKVAKELMRQCFRADALRNQMIHSYWPHRWAAFTNADTDKVLRRRVTAKAKAGLTIKEEETDPGQLLDTATYIGTLARNIQMFTLYHVAQVFPSGTSAASAKPQPDPSPEPNDPA